VIFGIGAAIVVVWLVGTFGCAAIHEQTKNELFNVMSKVFAFAGMVALGLLAITQK